MSTLETASSEAIQAGSAAPHFLVHNEGDHVAVAVQDVEPGTVRAVYLDSDREIALDAVERIPLGHKIALADLAEGADLVEYGVRVGLTKAPVKRGSLIHIHNMRSARWHQSR